MCAVGTLTAGLLLASCTAAKNPSERFEGGLDVIDVPSSEIDSLDVPSTPTDSFDVPTLTDIRLSDAPTCDGNLANNPLHCGACGRSCGAANCVEGHCATELRQLVGGQRNTCTLSYGGAVRCWGGNDNNESSQDILRSSSVSNIALNFPPDTVALSEGYATVCARHGALNMVSCWGYGTSGELGDGTNTERRISPVPVRTMLPDAVLSDVIEVSNGAFHSCVRRRNNAVLCWGLNAFGALGDGTRNSSNRAVAAAIPAGAGGLAVVLSVAAGDYNSYAVRGDGQVLSWGHNLAAQLGDPNAAALSQRAVPGLVGITDAKLVRAGGLNGCAIRNSGAMFCWGDNTYGQIGAGAPAPVHTPRDWMLPGNIVDAHLGLSFICALRDDGSVWCAGNNEHGELGDRTIANRAAPTRVGVYNDVIAIGGGRAHTCVIRRNNGVECWGLDENGQLGSARALYLPTPNMVQGVTEVPAEISAGELDSCYRTAGGMVYCWGSNSSGQTGSRRRTPETAPTAVISLPTSMQIQAGYLSTCSRNGGTLRCWGNNEYGQLGINSVDNENFTLSLVPGINALDVRERSGTVCAIHNGGNRALSCWGRNTLGEIDPLRVGTVVRAPMQQVATGITLVAPGVGHICAARAGGLTRCWGNNDAGQFGSGEMGVGSPRSATDAFAVGIPNVRTAGNVDLSFEKLASGLGFTCGINNSLNAYCWGDNTAGQLAQPMATPRSLFAMAVPGITGANAIVAGLYHACVLTGGRDMMNQPIPGAVYCWGDNTFGQIGTGTLVPPAYFSARQVMLPMLAVELSAGSQHTCARLVNNEIHCWGSNLGNQLGTRTPIYQTAPIVAR